MITTAAIRLLSVGTAAFALILSDPAARAGDISGSLPESGTHASNGADFKIINNAPGGATTRPKAIEGIVTGAQAFAVLGEATGTNSFALKAINTGVSDDFQPDGIAGYFEIKNPKSTSTQSAVYAIASGGRLKVPGQYGSAGVFTSSNVNNLSPIVSVAGGPIGNALVASVGGTGGGGNAVLGSDVTSAGGFAISGNSFNGYSAYFAGGFGGNGICSYAGGPDWTCSSDRNLKEHFAEVDLNAMLDRLDAMPVYYYQMKGSKLPTRFIGPTAQDFKAAFDIGDSDTMINGANAKGVALAAAKGLYRKLKQDEATISAQRAAILSDHDEIVALKQELSEQRAMIASLQASIVRLPRSTGHEGRMVYADK